jgi:glycosyltransferase involved in cell wall biosynthesis
LGIDAARVQVIHNGVDVDEFSPGASERARFGLPQAPFMLLFAGDLRMSRKNLDTVLHALVQTSANVHLAVAGILHNSPYPALVESLGLSSRVHFTGMVMDMPALMRSVDGFVFPSRYEPMGLVLLEALSAGLPVITVRTAGGAEVIASGSGIVLDDPNDDAALAAAITRLAGNADYARSLGERAREVARSLSWRAMAERYLTLYEQLHAQRAARSVPAGCATEPVKL